MSIFADSQECDVDGSRLQCGANPLYNLGRISVAIQQVVISDSRLFN
jgi:hypothetical protein